MVISKASFEISATLEINSLEYIKQNCKLHRAPVLIA